jgi:transcriptional regulator with XRE-family HTH domain
MTDFAGLLREWRKQRGFSQLGLALEADVSARHLACLETGRARPSRQMVLRLAETLDMPFAARNRLLDGAGFAPAYPSHALDSVEMAEVRAAILHLIGRHDPWPAIAIDRHWRVVALNRTAGAMFGALGLGAGDSMVEAFLSGPLGGAVENWGPVARHLHRRLRAESQQLGGDAVLDRAARALLSDPRFDRRAEERPAAFVPSVLVAGGQRLSFFSAIAAFGTLEAEEIDAMRIELFFPADDATRAALAVPD